MADETVVAVFDTAEHAAAAVRDLESAGIPSSAITQHAGTGTTGLSGKSGTDTLTHATTEEPRERGFWSSLFGGEPEYGHDTAVYDRSLQGGSTVVTVRGTGEHLDRVLDILERHNPVDIDDRATQYGVSQHIPGTGLTATNITETGAAGIAAAGTSAHPTTGTVAGANVGGNITNEPGTLSLSEETIAVGKRAINRGTTRVRRYVVETPVEETVNLRDEHVTVERRPVTDARPVSNADFSDKTIEVTEMAEEAVVSKQAHVREEIVIRKDVADRTETVRDTVRREDVEITKDPVSTERTGLTETTGTGTMSPNKPTI